MRLRAVAAVAAVLLASSGDGATASRLYAPRCYRTALSPDFAKDGTAFCLTWTRSPHYEPSQVPNVGTYTPDTKDVGLYRTTDRGRSWRRLETDLPWDSESNVGGIALSPLYRTDRLLAVHVGNYGVYTSTDGGEHFTAADPAARSAFGRPSFGGYLAPFAQSTATGPAGAFGFFDPSVAIAEQNPNRDPELMRTGWNGNSAIVPGVGGHLPVTAAPGLSGEGFQLSRTFGSGGRGYVLTSHVESFEGLLPPVWRFALWSCTPTLDCDDKRKVFPDNWGAWNLVLLDPAGQRLGIVLHENLTDLDKPARLHVWQSSDAGATWRPWTAVERLLAPFAAAARTAPEHSEQLPGVFIAADPGTRRVVVRVTGSATDENDRPVPASRYLAANGEQIWVSDDAGATFRRTAYGPSAGQRGKGTLPWHGSDAKAAVRLDVAPDGRIFATGFTLSGARVTYLGLFCSADGRRWARFC